VALNNLGLGLLITAKDTASGVFNRVGRSVVGVDKQLAKSGKAFSHTGHELRATGARMMGAGLALGAGLGFAVHEAGKFGKKIKEVTTLTSEAEFPTEKMKQVTMDLAEQFGLPAYEQAGALYQTISAGVIDAAKATDLLTVANKLAIGGVTDVTTSVDVLTSAVANYGTSGVDATRASDILFTTVRLGKTTANELGASLGRILPTAAAVGVSMEEIGAATAALTKGGLPTRQAVTGLNAALTNILKPSEQASEAAKKLGLDFSMAGIQAAGGLLPFMEEIIQKSGGDKQALIELFGSVRGINAAFKLTSEGGKEFRDAMEQMKSSAGATEGAFKKMDKGLGPATKKLKTSFQNAMIDIGAALAPIIQLVAVFVTRGVKAFRSLPGPIKTLLAGLAAAAAVALTFAGGLLVVLGTVAGLVAAKAMFLVALKAVAIAFVLIGLAIAPLILLVAALKVAWENNIGGIRDFGTKAFEDITLAVESLMALFKTGRLTGDLKQRFLDADPALQGFITDVFLFGHRVMNFFKGIGRGFTEAIKQVEPTIKEIKTALSTIGQAFLGAADSPDKAKEKFEQFGSAGESVGETLGKIAGLILRVVAAATELAAGFAKAWTELGPVWDSLGTSFKLVGKSFEELVTAITGKDANAQSSTSVWETFGSLVAGAIGFVAWGFGILLRVVGAVLGIFATLIGIVRLVATILGSVLGTAISIVTGILAGNWSQAWRGAVRIVLEAVKLIVVAVTGMVKTIASLMDGVGKIFGKDFGAAKFISGVEQDILKDLSDLQDKVDPKRAKPPPGQAAAKEAPLAILEPLPGVQPPATAAAAGAGGVANLNADQLTMLGKQQTKVTADIKLATKVELDRVALGEAVAKMVKELDAQEGGA